MLPLQPYSALHSLQVNKVWVHEGRFYNYAKPGSTEYSSAHSAAAATTAAKAAAEAIHGLGQASLVISVFPICRSSDQSGSWACLRHIYGSFHFSE